MIYQLLILTLMLSTQVNANQIQNNNGYNIATPVDPKGVCNCTTNPSACPQDYCISVPTQPTTYTNTVYTTQTSTQTQTNSAPLNPDLVKCMNAPAFAPTAAVKNRPAADYDCTPTPRDAQGITHKDYKTWSDKLYSGGSKSSEVTGYYTKDAVRCTAATASSKECPISVKALFVYDCDPTQPLVGGKCPKASKISVYHATFQEFIIPGEAPLKSKIVGDSGVSDSAIAATPISASAFTGYVNDKKDFSCAGIDPSYIQLGVDQSGDPLCGPDPKQATIDAQAAQITAMKQEMEKSLCDVETAQVMASGGTTTHCSPQFTKYYLYGGSHITNDCFENKGTLIRLDGSLTKSGLSQKDNKKLFCKFSGSKCPGSFQEYTSNGKKWTTTTASSATGYCSSNMMCASCSGDTCSTGSHPFSNADAEGACSVENKTRNGSCGIDGTGGYNSSYAATITEIGCY